MQDKPDLPDEVIIACLSHTYGVESIGIKFLPIGFDSDAWVYRVDATDGPYFLKLKRRVAEEAMLAVP